VPRHIKQRTPTDAATTNFTPNPTLADVRYSIRNDLSDKEGVRQGARRACAGQERAPSEGPLGAQTDILGRSG
jgi:hypothetical protein